MELFYLIFEKGIASIALRPFRLFSLLVSSGLSNELFQTLRRYHLGQP
jgi:hypothetical protein